MTIQSKILVIAACSIVSCVNAKAQLSLSTDELIINTTTYLSRTTDTVVNGQEKFFHRGGTGFFFDLERNKDTIPGIITNRHVLSDMDSCVIKFNIIGNNRIEYGRFVTVTIPVKNNPYIFYHPEADLAFIKLEPILDLLKRKYTGEPPVSFAAYYEQNILPDSSQWKIGSIAQVLMIGYPENIYDYNNYVPVVSGGLTATPYFLDYKGRREFMINIPSFQGTSGSPVVFFSQSRSGQIGTPSVTELYLLGINAEMLTSAKTGTPVNLDISIKASQILYFKTVVN